MRYLLPLIPFGVFICVGLCFGTVDFERLFSTLFSYPPALIVVLFFCLIWLARNWEVRRWNKGVCRDCETAWVYFDTDSQGGRGYKCQCEEGHVEWISYPWIDNGYVEPKLA